MGVIRVGTSSWADRHLVSSGWYPRELNTSAGRLAYYAESFDLVEVDTTFYAIPAPETAAAWAARTPTGFTFDVKAFSLFSGHSTAVSMLAPELRPPGDDDRKVRHRDLSQAVYDELWARFHAVLDPLATAGKLGAVLLQFPSWMARGDRARRSIAASVERCRPHRVAVELQHPSWLEPAVLLDTLRFLQSLDASYSCVGDPFVSTAEPAMVRFQGHNHVYALSAVSETAERLRTLADQVEELHVLVDNCCTDRGPRNAAQLAALLHLTDQPA